MRTSTRLASVLTGLALACGGVAFVAPVAHAAPADVSACINQVEQELRGGEAPMTVRVACTLAVAGDQAHCVSGLTTANGVTNGTAVSACRVAAE